MDFNKPLSTPKRLDWSEIEKVPVHENRSPLVALHETQKLKLEPIYYKLGLDGAINSIYLREEVVQRLYQAANQLPQNVGLLVLDGWRPLSVQCSLRKKMHQEILSKHPTASAEWIENELDNFVANPNRSGMRPPHLTGGSVDVTLYNIQSMTALDMGGEFDETGIRSFTNALEKITDITKQSAKTNRRILVNTMINAGFTNIPTEWWHFDYGNANWAYFSDNPISFYGAIDCLE